MSSNQNETNAALAMHVAGATVRHEGRFSDLKVLENDELDEWVNIFLEKDIEIFQAPMVEEFNFNKIESNITNFQIEDLLNRTPIKIIENDQIFFY